MDILEFFQTILPDEGNYYLVLFSATLNDKQGNPIKIHKPYSDLDTMAHAAKRFDVDPKYLAVYHACASYRTPYIELEELNEWGKPKRKYRGAENQYKAKAFWVDIDCGQAKFDKGEGYLTKRDATAALFKFCDLLELPRPMLVDSGNGVHAYWPLTKPVKVEPWTRVAAALKACLAHAGVIADPTRTADFASILRPPSTSNRKGGEPKTVAVRRICDLIEPEAFAAALAVYVKAHNVKLVKEKLARQAPKPDNLNSDLTGHLSQYPELDSSGDLAADKCSQLAQMRATKGDVSYEHWRGVIGVLKHCVDGEALAEAWSAERLDSGHDQDDWRTRYDTWDTGPTSCDFFAKCNPLACEGCEFKGKVKGPIMLGRIIPANEEKVETVLNDAGEECEVDVPALAHGYTWGNHVLARLVPDADGIMQTLPFSTTLFYPVSRIRCEDGTYRIGMRMHLPNKKVRDFEMPSASMASQTDMLRSLATYELMHSNHKNAGLHMAAYLRDQLEALKRKVEEVNTLTTFGWKHDESEFLIGDRLYLRDGTTRKVLVSGGAAKYLSAFNRPKTASVKDYADALNLLYNQAGREHWQYAIVAGWGSILAPFCEELYKGLVLALQGGDSGKGKTTVSYASMYAFGNAADMAMNSKDGFTYNALWAVMATFNNIPILLDELTNMDGQVFSDMAYGVAAGKEKVRMTSKGGSVNFATTMQWRMSPFVTGNRDFHGLLATTQANSQAEAVRLVQINIDRFPKTYLVQSEIDREELSPEERDELNALEAAMVQQAVEVMKANRGIAGELMVQYVLANSGAVADEVRQVVSDFVKILPDAKYRFYRCHAACSLVMARIAKDLGIIDFDLAALRNFTEELMTDLAETVTVTNTVTAEDAFSRMMGSLAHRILVTQEFRDKRHKSGPESPRNRITAEIAGRYVLGSPNSKDCAGHIMISQKEVRDWCMKNRADYNRMIDQLEEDGALIKRSEKLTLTRGTDLPTVQARCIVVDSYKLDRDALTVVSDKVANVVDMAAVSNV